MKNLLFTIEYPPQTGGVANYYFNLIENWPEPDNICILSPDNAGLLSRWLYPKWLPAIFALQKTIKKEKISHVIVGQILPLGIVSLLVAKLTNTSFSVIIHGMDIVYAQRTKRKRKISLKILSKSKNIICASEYTAKLVKDFIGEAFSAKIHVVNPGIKEPPRINEDIERKIQKKHRVFNKVVMFSVGRLVKRKGFDTVISVMPEAVRVSPNLYYFIAGDGPDKEYIYKLAKGIPNIVFLGKISDEEKWAWLKLCDFFITVSRDIEGDFEGFGIVYLEAGICGKPVIAGDSGGVRDAVKGAYSGLLVDPDNLERISGAIIRLSRDEELRKKLGEQGRKRAIEEFNWQKQIRKIFELVIHDS